MLIDRLARRPTEVEEMLLGITVREVPKLVPGLLLCGVLVTMFVLLTDLTNAALGLNGVISYILSVMVAGMLIRNFVRVPETFLPGIAFCPKKLLRLGIILMGIRLSILDVLKVSAWSVPIVVVSVLTGLVVTSYFGRVLKLPVRLSTLIAVGTSICGATAIVATAPAIDAKDEEVTYAVANITIFGLGAMLIYPFVSNWIFDGDPVMSGLFIGAAIHETSQVAASGLVYDQTFHTAVSPNVADIAVVTKLVRNVLMAVVLPLMILAYVRRTGSLGALQKSGHKVMLRVFPLFILGFLSMAVFRSIGDAGAYGSGLAFGVLRSQDWASITSGIGQWSGYVLATAMAGVGLGTSFKSMSRLGIKPFFVGLLAALIVGIAAVTMVMTLGRFLGT